MAMASAKAIAHPWPLLFPHGLYGSAKSWQRTAAHPQLPSAGGGGGAAAVWWGARGDCTFGLYPEIGPHLTSPAHLWVRFISQQPDLGTWSKLLVGIYLQKVLGQSLICGMSSPRETMEFHKSGNGNSTQAIYIIMEITWQERGTKLYVEIYVCI